MFTLGGGAKVYLATGATDLRRSFSLHTIAQHRLGFAQPLNGDVFGFINKRRDLVKFFWFAEGGLCVIAKRQPESSFRWVKNSAALWPACRSLPIEAPPDADHETRRRYLSKSDTYLFLAWDLLGYLLPWGILTFRKETHPSTSERQP